MGEGGDDAARSLEFRFLIDRALVARQLGRQDVADAFARAAEGILKAAFPHLASDIGHAAARKGQGDVIGARLVRHLDAASAACVATVLLLRGARRPVVDVLSNAFRHDPDFDDMIRKLCGQALQPSRSPIAQDSIHPVPIEVAAPAVR